MRAERARPGEFFDAQFDPVCFFQTPSGLQIITLVQV